MFSRDVVHEISHQTYPDVETALFMLRDHYCIGNITYHLSQTIIGEISVDSPYVKTTYPPEWVSRYLLRRYIEVDPIVRAGMLRALPFGWSEVVLVQEAAEMMADFFGQGFSRDGYSIPIIDKAGRRALFSVNARSDQDNWREIVSSLKTEWAEIAHVIHKMAIAELFDPDKPFISLSPREQEVLTWAARGKDYLEIGIIMDISGHTVRSYMRSARYKLDCVNLTQAVAKAAKLRLIRT